MRAMVIGIIRMLANAIAMKIVISDAPDALPATTIRFDGRAQIIGTVKTVSTRERLASLATLPKPTNAEIRIKAGSVKRLATPRRNHDQS